MSTGINDPFRCPHCSNFHTGHCPEVKAIEYFPDGKIKRVEYHGWSLSEIKAKS